MAKFSSFTIATGTRRVAFLDHEHKQLIDLINCLHNEFSKQGAKHTVAALFGDLLKSISLHFALEERFMCDPRYDQLQQHKGDHERLLDEIRDLMDDFEETGEMQSAELTTRLEARFSRHFDTHDARLHKALAAATDRFSRLDLSGRTGTGLFRTLTGPACSGSVYPAAGSRIWST